MLTNSEPIARTNKLVNVDANKGVEVKPQYNDAVEEKKPCPKIVVRDESENTAKPIIEQAEKEITEVAEVKEVPRETAIPEKTSPDIIFKVQIMASSKDIPLHAENFKGLNTLSKESFNNLYRYMYGSTDSHFQATLLKSNADAKGYTTSYIVAYRNGERISETEALKYLSE